MSAHVRVCIDLDTRIGFYEHIQTHMHAYMHLSIHPPIPTYLHICINAHITVILDGPSVSNRQESDFRVQPAGPVPEGQAQP